MFKILYYLENKFQKIFVNNFQYYIIVLKKLIICILKSKQNI